MREERIELSGQDRLKVLHEIQEGHLLRVQPAKRLRLTERHVRRLLAQLRLRTEGDGGLVHGVRGRPSNRKIPAAIEQRSVHLVQQPYFADFGPTLGAEHLSRHEMAVSR